MMNLGLTFTQASPLDRMADLWKAMDNSRIHSVGVPDSPALLREMYVAMTVAALATSRIRIINWVTNPVTRHPSVTAAALMSLAELAPGRISLGIATGDSALWATGQKAAKVDYLRDYIRAVRAMCRGEEVRWAGAVFRPNWANWKPVDVPIYVACSGPKVLTMAAQEADGLIVTMGFSPPMIAMVQDTIKTACAAVGRDPATIDFWSNAHLHFAESREVASHYMLGWTTNWLTEMTTAGKGIPDRVVPKLLEFNRDIHDMDAVYKTPDRGRMLVERAKRLGIYDWVMECSPQLFGTPADIRERLKMYSGLGLKNWFFLYSSRGTFVGGSEKEKYDFIDKLSNELIQQLA
ncbi:MAG: LLM class flavin-dependent oxidoreductase [Alphaproteobacteria bacterium]|nr:LLM class flavin-dependent oxidoreductase [Alphaproteobacteria bacterium]